MIRLVALFTWLLISLACAAAPPPVPALPDTARISTYTVSGTKCVCAVGFQIYGDSQGTNSDVDNWIQVFINGSRVLSSDPSHGWILSSVTGPLWFIPRPITDAVLTFNSDQTGTVQIVGARRPRRLLQFPEGRGVAARDLNQAITDIVAQNRENWDRINNTFPSTLPNAGQLLIGQSSGPPAWVTPSGDVSLAPNGTFTVGSINGVPFSGFTTNNPLIFNGTSVSSATKSGTTTNFATVSGPTTPGNCLNWDASGNIVSGPGACVSSGSGVTAGSRGQTAYYAANGSIVSGIAPGSLTRALIPTSTPPAGSFMTVGYRTAGDLGYGAVYTSVGASSTGLQAIQDANGTWWNLVITDKVNVGWFGAYGNGSSHQISSGDIAANPAWRGTYTAGNEWDYVAIQESLYAAFAVNSTPGSVLWNTRVAAGEIFTSNHPWYEPNGNFQINHQVLLAASHGRMTWSGKGSSQWTWTGALATTMFYCNACSYMEFDAPTLANNNIESYGSAKPVWVIDYDFSIPDQLRVQQDTIKDAIVSVNVNGFGLSLSPTNGAQGDTIAIINSVFLGNISDTAVQICCDNGLEITFTNSDIQGFIHNGVAITGGSAQFEGTHAESEAFFNEFSIAPAMTQFTTDGADVRMYLQVSGSAPSILKGWRSEGNIIASSATGGGIFAGFGAFGMEVLGAAALGGDIHTSSASAAFQRGVVYQQGTTKPRAFMVVDNGGTAWRAISSGAGQTITDSGASYTVNQWVGYNVFLRFGTNGFYNNCPITANTATTITFTGCSASFTSQNSYQIAGNTAGVVPNFDTLANGFENFFPGGGHGWNLTAGSSCIDAATGDITSVGGVVGWYVMVPNADNINPGGGNPIYPSALYGRITAFQATACSGGAGASFLIDHPAAYTLSQSIGYFGPVLTDGTQGVKWMNLAYQSISPVNIASDVALPVGSLWYPQTGQRISSQRLDWPATAFNFGAPVNPIFSTFNVTHGAQYEIACQFIAGPSSPLDLTEFLRGCNTILISLSSDVTVTTTPFSGGSAGVIDQNVTIQVAGDGASAHTLTFGSGFDSTLPVISRSPAGTTPTTITFHVNQTTLNLSEVARSTESNASVTSPFSVASSATLANVPGLSLTLPGGNLRYKVRAVLFVTSLAAAGGVQAALGGTVALNSIIYSGWGMDSGATPVRGYAQASSLGSPVASATGWNSTTPTLIIEGEAYAGSTGTLTVQFAQNTSNATASVVGSGSYLTATPLTP